MPTDREARRSRRKKINRSAWCALPAALLVGLVVPVLLIEAVHGDPFPFIRKLGGEFLSQRIETKGGQQVEVLVYRFRTDEKVLEETLDRDLPFPQWRVYKLRTPPDHPTFPNLPTFLTYNRDGGESVQVQFSSDWETRLTYRRIHRGGFAQLWQQVVDGFSAKKLKAAGSAPADG